MNKHEAILAILDIKRDWPDGTHMNFPWDALNEAFRLFWITQPTEEEFSRVMHRCPLSATMLYRMVQSRE